MKGRKLSLEPFTLCARDAIQPISPSTKTEWQFIPPVCHQPPFIIGIAGGTASGKTTVCHRITQALGDQRVVLLSLDEFYRDLTAEECANIKEVDFDAPTAFDIDTLKNCLKDLKNCRSVDVPVYDFCTSKRSQEQSRRVDPANVVILEGILVLQIPAILKHLNMKIFVDTDDDTRLARRIRRDTVERGRDVEGVLSQYTRFVKPAFEKYVLPSKQNADVVIPWKDDNTVAVDLIAQHIRSKVNVSDLRRIYPGLKLLESTNQTRAMHTRIRDRTTPRTDFVFYADRLIRLVVEMALGELPFNETTVTTPGGDLYSGVSFCRRLCGVSMIRSGEAMENALRACCLGVKIGKMMIPGENPVEAGHTLVFIKLPPDIAKRHVLLMEPILATGKKVKSAAEVLIHELGVDESKVFLLTLIAAPEGIHTVCSAFPKIKVLTSEIDVGLSDDNQGHVRPGIGDFSDRYFGTGSLEYEWRSVGVRQVTPPSEPDSSPR